MCQLIFRLTKTRRISPETKTLAVAQCALQFAELFDRHDLSNIAFARSDLLEVVTQHACTTLRVANSKRFSFGRHDLRKRRHDELQDGMFSSISMEQRVPVDHPLRRVRALVIAALQQMSPQFSALHTRSGRP